MKKWYVRMFVFFSILFILIEISSIIFIPNKSNLVEFGFFKKTKYDLLDEKNNTVDVIFLGDSLVYNSVSPMYIWNHYGYTTFDAAIPAMTIEEAYDYSKVIVASQHPKLVMFEADVLYRDLHHIERYKYKILDLKKFVPLLTFHNNWKQIGESDWVNPYKGFKFSSKVDGPKRPRDLHETNAVKPIDELNLEYFEKMMKLYQDNGIEVMFIENPTVNWQYDEHNRIVELAEEYNLELLDLNLTDIGIDWAKETKDEGVHMNYLGARKVSKYLAEYIKSLDIVEDHREDENYSLWNKSYELYRSKLFDELDSNKDSKKDAMPEKDKSLNKEERFEKKEQIKKEKELEKEEKKADKEAKKEEKSNNKKTTKDDKVVEKKSKEKKNKSS